MRKGQFGHRCRIPETYRGRVFPNTEMCSEQVDQRLSSIRSILLTADEFSIIQSCNEH